MLSTRAGLSGTFLALGTLTTGFGGTVFVRGETGLAVTLAPAGFADAVLGVLLFLTCGAAGFVDVLRLLLMSVFGYRS